MTRAHLAQRTLLCAALLAGTGWRPPASAAAERRQDIESLLFRYARGERAAAVAELGRFAQGELERHLGQVRSLLAAAERCPSSECAAAEELRRLPLRAAVMLHWDRYEADRPPPIGVEQPRACLTPLGVLAGQYAALLTRIPEHRDFARRFFLAMVLFSQWDYCLDDARSWGETGLSWFPRDPALLLALGCVYEEAATLGGRLASTGFASSSRAPFPSTRADPDAERLRSFREARRLFEEAVNGDPAAALPRIHLGRVLWRLSEEEPATSALQSALERARGPEERFLAHLFLGRLHEDAERLEQAAAQYRKALLIDPTAQTAAVALSHALRLGGDQAAARDVLVQGLAPAGGRQRRDAYWDYLVASGWDKERLVADLQRDSLQ